MFLRLMCFLFISVLCLGCQSVNDRSKQLSIARIACGESPQTFDPRAARYLIDASFLNCFYEGLMRIDSAGNLVPGMAEHVIISPDLLTYTFHLRPAFWSNGDPVTSKDFAYSWSSPLDPQFPAPNAFQLYPIKNARSVKSGALPADHLAIYTPDAQTLVVTLEKPTPYFLELTTFFTLFPVHQHERTASNGPFQLVHHALKDEVVAARNSYYWDREAVKLDEVHFIFIDERTALGLMETGELDLIGSPLSALPTDAIGALGDRVQGVTAAGTQWLRFQVEKEPLNKLAVRKALTLAINRQALIDHVVHGNQLPAMGLVPPGALWQARSYFVDNDIAAARSALQEAGAIAPLTLTYTQSERNHRMAQALQEQWRVALGLQITLEALEPQTASHKIKNQDYQIAIGSWFADIRDPINFLSVFESKDNGTNNTQWESSRYRELLVQSDLALETSQREKLLQQAEEALMTELPISPLFHYRLNYLQNPRLKGVVVSELGIINLRDAYFE